MAVQPMAFPGAAAEPRPTRTRPTQNEGELRGSEAKTRRPESRDQAEDADFADIHASLSTREAPVEPTPAPIRIDAGATAAPTPAAATSADAATPEIDTEAAFDMDAEGDSFEVAAPTEDAADPAAPTMRAPDAAPTDDGAQADAPRDAPAPREPMAAPVAGLNPDAPKTEAPRAETRGADSADRPARADAPAPRAAPSAAAAPAAGNASTAAPEAEISAASTAGAATEQPRTEAAAAAETTARRAEAALERRGDPAATPNAPPAGGETIQAVRATAPAAATPQGPPQPGMAETRPVTNEASVAAEADRALAEADALGVGAGHEARAAQATLAAATPVVDRSQAAAAMAQIAPTLRKGADGTTEIRLDPPELGRVRLTLRTDETGLVATVLAERPETMDMMRRNADILLRDLAASGQTRVDLSFGSLGAENGGGDRDRGDDAPRILTGLDKPGKAPGADLAAQLRLSRAAGGLDIRV